MQLKTLVVSCFRCGWIKALKHFFAGWLSLFQLLLCFLMVTFVLSHRSSSCVKIAASRAQAQLIFYHVSISSEIELYLFFSYVVLAGFGRSLTSSLCACTAFHPIRASALMAILASLPSLEVRWWKGSVSPRSRS